MKILFTGILILLSVQANASLVDVVKKDFTSIDQTKPICVYLGGAYRPVTAISAKAVVDAGARSCQSGKARTMLYKATKQTNFIKLKKGNFSVSDYEKLDTAFIINRAK